MMPAMKTKTKAVPAVDSSGEKEKKYELKNIYHLFLKTSWRLTNLIENLDSNLN
jgi:hypothetical protein